MGPPPDSNNNEVEEDTTSKYKEILKNSGVTEPVSEVIVNDSGLLGEGFASQQLYITVKFENPKVPKLNLFGKALTTSASHSKMIEEGKVFEKEARFFMEYVPAAEKLCKKKGQLGLMDIYPKCYYGDEKLVLMENLVLDKGYGLLNKEDKHNLDEAKVALLTLAKHHAVSYAMIQEYGGAEGFIKAFKNFDFDIFTSSSAREMFGPMITNSVTNNRKMLEKYPIKGKDAVLERLKTEGERAFEIAMENVQLNEDDTPLVLCHGDYHGNNMMFLKDPKTQKILGHKAIDLQIVRVNTPATDVAYYLYTCLNSEVRRGHFKELLNFYLDNFNKICRELGHPIELSYEEFFLQYRKKFKYGFWIGFIFVGPFPAIMKEINVGDMENLSDFGLQCEKAIQKWIKENPDKGGKIAKEVVDVIEEYYELCLNN